MLLSLALVLMSLLSNIGTVKVLATDGNKLKEHLIHIETTKAENGFQDLEPLKEILKDKRIIGIGEFYCRCKRVLRDETSYG